MTQRFVIRQPEIEAIIKAIVARTAGKDCKASSVAWNDDDQNEFGNGITATVDVELPPLALDQEDFATIHKNWGAG